MKSHRHYWLKIKGILILLLFLSCAFDIASAYHYSPDLNYEANPLLLNLFGVGWSQITFLTVIYIDAMLFLCFRLAACNHKKPFFFLKNYTYYYFIYPLICVHRI